MGQQQESDSGLWTIAWNHILYSSRKLDSALLVILFCTVGYSSKTDSYCEQLQEIRLNTFFSCCFWWIRSPFLFLVPSAAPQMTAYSEVPSQMAAHLRIHCGLGRLPGTGVAIIDPPLLHDSGESDFVQGQQQGIRFCTMGHKRKSNFAT